MMMMLARRSFLSALVATLFFLSSIVQVTAAPMPHYEPVVVARQEETATTTPEDFQKQNALDAQALNAKFLTLKNGDPCEAEETACIDGIIALCENGNFAQIGSCAGGTECAALPLVARPGTSVTCAFPDDILDRMEAAGASRSVTGSDVQEEGNTESPSPESTTSAEAEVSAGQDGDDDECFDDVDESQDTDTPEEPVESAAPAPVITVTVTQGAAEPSGTSLPISEADQTAQAATESSTALQLTARPTESILRLNRRQTLVPEATAPLVVSSATLGAVTPVPTIEPAAAQSAQVRVATVVTTMTLTITLADDTAAAPSSTQPFVFPPPITSISTTQIATPQAAVNTVISPSAEVSSAVPSSTPSTTTSGGVGFTFVTAPVASPVTTNTVDPVDVASLLTATI